MITANKCSKLITNLTKLIQASILVVTVVIALLLITMPAMAEGGYTWTERTNADASPGFWLDVASSADGTKLAAAAYSDGPISTSTDSGATWTKQTAAGLRYWNSITSSADGTNLAATVIDGYIYTSTDSGATWTERTNAGSRRWQSISSSADGTKLVAISNGVFFGGSIYTSTDSGATWTKQTAAGNRLWQSVASSSDGVKLVAGDDSGSIYTSTDSGATWTEQTGPGQPTSISITSSADGTKLATFERGGYIYTSTDSGATWTEQLAAGSRYWNSITSSADGTKLAAVVAESNSYGAFTPGYIYTSTDSGATWIQQTSSGSRNWWSITSSADGTKLAAADSGGTIHTSTFTSPPTQTTFPNSTNFNNITLTTPVNTTLTCNSANTETELTTQDGDYQYPLGLVDFCLTVPTSSTQDITLTFETELTPSDVVARKYNSITKQYGNVIDAIIIEDITDGKHVLILSYQITDGGVLDEDGIANGEVLDPVGLAVSNDNVITANSIVSSTSTNGSTLAKTGENITIQFIVAISIFSGGFGLSLDAVRRLKTAKVS
jgi:hypothetical protein